MAQMFNPPHPGETLREDILPELGLTVAAAARQFQPTGRCLATDAGGLRPLGDPPKRQATPGGAGTPESGLKSSRCR